MPSAYLTREGFEKLQRELEYLRNEKRDEVAMRLKEAMEDGELIENAEYEDAKNEQAFTEGRIKDLELLLASPRIIDQDEENEHGAIEVGSKVTIREDKREPENFMIVGPAEADPKQNRISNESPLGRALMKHHLGEKVKVEAPGGTFVIEVLKVE